MRYEIEIKCPLKTPGPLRQRLHELGARYEGKDRERNLVLDTDRRELHKQNKLLRVRIVNGACTVTFKGPAQQARRAKKREELEFEAREPEKVLALLAGLGYTPWWAYEKERENYRLGKAHVVLDRLPRLGWFCEIEAPSERTVLALARRLGLPEGKLTHKSYGELAREHFAPGKLRDLTFR